MRINIFVNHKLFLHKYNSRFSHSAKIGNGEDFCKKKEQLFDDRNSKILKFLYTAYANSKS
jgi:hypothetical protein